MQQNVDQKTSKVEIKRNEKKKQNFYQKYRKDSKKTK